MRSTYTRYRLFNPCTARRTRHTCNCVLLLFHSVNHALSRDILSISVFSLYIIYILLSASLTICINRAKLYLTTYISEENMLADIIIITVIAAICAAIAVRIIIKRKKGGASCSCGCGGCSMADVCHKKTK